MQTVLADHFWKEAFSERTEPSLRSIIELPWLLEQPGDRDRLRSCITHDTMFSALCVELGMGEQPVELSAFVLCCLCCEERMDLT